MPTLADKIKEVSSGDKEARHQWIEVRGETFYMTVNWFSQTAGEFTIPSKIVPLLVHTISDDETGRHVDVYSIGARDICLAHTHTYWVNDEETVERDTSLERLKDYADVFKKAVATQRYLPWTLKSLWPFSLQ